MKKIGEIHKKSDLKFGQALPVQDGRVFHIQLKGTLFNKPYLELLIDGKSYTYRYAAPTEKIYKVFQVLLINTSYFAV